MRHPFCAHPLEKKAVCSVNSECTQASSVSEASFLNELTAKSAKKLMFEPPRMSQWILSAFSEASALIELTTRLATRRPRFGVEHPRRAGRSGTFRR